MKYLLQNKDALARAIAGFVVALITLLTAIGVIDIDQSSVNEETIIAVINGIIMFICFFYNNPTSKENSEHTGAMRLEKKQNRGIIEGENFTDDAE